MPSIPKRSFPLRGLLLALILAVGLPGCGAGGTSDGGLILDGGSAAGPLTITTTSMPPGSLEVTYAPTQLVAVNAQGTAAWSLAAGSLPAGLTLGAGGLIAGTPEEQGWFPFTVCVEDDLTTDTQDLGVAVDTIALAATSGLVAGDAWTDRPVTLTVSGQSATVTFTVVANESGGALTGVDPIAGTATWTPGTTGGTGVADEIRASEIGGATADLSLPVMPNPAESHTASFGSTDVWWIDPHLKLGSHAHASDLQASLAAVGLRDPASTSAVGTEADELAAAWVRVELLRQLNPMYLRNADGTAGAQGLPICFPFDEPGPGYLKPTAASWLTGGTNRYSQMGLVDGTLTGVVGTAFVDSTANERHENDTTDDDVELGVFANQLVSVFNFSYSNPLVDQPVGEDDVAALRALLYELPNPGGRYVQLRNIGRGFARSVAAVVAHEIGHSLGLPHNAQTVPGAIMNTGATIHPSATYEFTAENVAILQGALPGLGRSGSQQGFKPGSPPALPEGGVVVCNCRIHAGAPTSGH